MPSRVAMPEWLTRHDREPSSWTVLSGPLLRGEAFTDLAECRMRVPAGSDETSRCVRAHELMHAKVSPMVLWRPDDLAHLSDDVLVTAEEFRINQLVKEAGFPVAQHLADGSETRSGERIGANGDWNAAVMMLVATSGTKGFRGLMTGLRRTRPDWIPQLRAIDRHLKKMWARSVVSGLSSVASTIPHGAAPLGWQFTLGVAQYVHGILTVASPTVDPGFECPGGGARGTFARFVLADLPLVQRIPGHLRTARTPSATGRHPRHLERLLTDPERRVFDRRVHAAGGVVLVDQSGSMRLTDDDVWNMIRAAPGCTVIGYSHESRSTGVPNVWVLARDGRVVARVPRGNGGNGVDGPALRFASSLRRRNDPLIWVCDGYVTDAFDDHSDVLTRECADLVVRHRVHQVPDVSSALSALSRTARGIRLSTRAIGPIASACRAT